MAVAQEACYFSQLLRRCPEPPTGVCQYCGRHFCSRHGDTLDEGQQVCHRQRCQRKVGDLRAHRAYLSLVGLRNSQQMCGAAGCDHEPQAQCSHCEGLFCDAHVHPRRRVVRRESGVVQEPVSLCDHCWRRHDLWSEA